MGRRLTSIGSRASLRTPRPDSESIARRCWGNRGWIARRSCFRSIESAQRSRGCRGCSAPDRLLGDCRAVEFLHVHPHDSPTGSHPVAVRHRGTDPSVESRPRGALAMLVPSCLPVWSVWPSTLPAVCIVAVLAYLVGAVWVAQGWDSTGRSWRALVVALLVWWAGFPMLPTILLSSWQYVTGAMLVVLTLCAFYRRLPAALQGKHADWRHASAALLVTFGTMITNEREWRFAVIGALGFLLGRQAGRSCQGLSSLGTPAWLAYVASLVWGFSLVHKWAVLGPLRSVLTVAGGAGAAAILAWVLPSRLLLRHERPHPDAGRERWFPYLAVLGLVLTNLSRPWFGALIAGSALVIARTRSRPAWRSVGAFALAGVLMLAILPGPPNTTIDPFHHGQILESVWEFESGRPLYSEVFPLRSFEFFLTWLARRVSKPTLANFFITDHLLDSLPIAGVCLLTFAWTRSLPWSFATAWARLAIRRRAAGWPYPSGCRAGYRGVPISEPTESRVDCYGRLGRGTSWFRRLDSPDRLVAADDRIRRPTEEVASERRRSGRRRESSSSVCAPW